MANKKENTNEFVNPFDKGVSYDDFLKSIPKGTKVEDYLKGQISEDKIQTILKELKLLKKDVVKVEQEIINN